MSICSELMCGQCCITRKGRPARNTPHTQCAGYAPRGMNPHSNRGESRWPDTFTVAALTDHDRAIDLFFHPCTPNSPPPRTTELINTPSSVSSKFYRKFYAFPFLLFTGRLIIFKIRSLSEDTNRDRYRIRKQDQSSPTIQRSDNRSNVCTDSTDERTELLLCKELSRRRRWTFQNAESVVKIYGQSRHGLRSLAAY